MPGPAGFGLIQSLSELRDLCQQILELPSPFAIDVETGYKGAYQEKGSLRVETNLLAGFSLAHSIDWAKYTPLAHDLGSSNLDPQLVAAELWPVLQTGRAVAHNAKFEMRNLARFFREFLAGEPEVEKSRGYFPMYGCTMVMAYVLQNWPMVGLKSLVDTLFGYKQAELSSLFPNIKRNAAKDMRFNQLELTPAVISYACDDTAWDLRLLQYLEPLIEASSRHKFIYRLELSLLPILCDMEDYGVLLAWDEIEAAVDEAEHFARALEADVHNKLSERLGERISINLNSSKQLSDILYSEPPFGLGLPAGRFTKGTRDSETKKPSTDVIALGSLAQREPAVRYIIDYKELRKLLSAYLIKFAQANSAPDGRAHAGIKNTRVVTGRFAVEDFNYQQLPKPYHKELPTGEVFELQFRDFVKAGPEHYLLGFDLSQGELRAVAGLAQERSLLEAFERGEDVHTKVSSLMFGVPIDQVDASLRDKGKTLNFALLYQLGIKGLADRLNISRDEASDLYSRYFSTLPAIGSWVQGTKVSGANSGFTVSHFGRKHMIWDLQSEYPSIRAKGERVCVNAPVQGWLADYVKIGMVRAYRALDKAGLLDNVHLVMNVHDALIYEIHKSVRPQDVVRIVNPEVTFPVPGWPAMVADWEIGFRWGSMRKLIVINEDDGSVRLEPKPEKKTAAESAPEPATSEPSPTPSPEKIMPQEPVQPRAEATTILEWAAAPTRAELSSFVAHLKRFPGDTLLTLRLPDVPDTNLPIRTSLTVEDLREVVSLLFFSEVRVYQPHESVDFAKTFATVSID